MAGGFSTNLVDAEAGFLGKAVAAGCESSLGIAGVVGGPSGWVAECVDVCEFLWRAASLLPLGCHSPGSLRTSLLPLILSPYDSSFTDSSSAFLQGQVFLA